MAQSPSAAIPNVAAPREEPWARKTGLGLAFCGPLILIFLILVVTPMLY